MEAGCILQSVLAEPNRTANWRFAVRLESLNLNFCLSISLSLSLSMALNAPARDDAFQEQFIYKSLLQEYAQKSAISSPEYRTVNEGHQHAPQFRSSVLVGGKTFTSHGTFFHLKAAEHDVAKLALESLSREIESEAVPLIQQSSNQSDFFTEYGEASRYQIQEVVGKGSYGVVGAAVDTHNGEKVAIKKINDVFEHVSDATRILREIKLLRLLRHPDIVEIKHIMLPPSRREFKDIYVVFELMESDLHQVIKANDDLTPEHHQFFLYQLLRAMKYIHTANVFHRDLKPKNILANADCKLKVCDFGLARVSFDDAPSTIFWTDYVATRWYRAPELCGSFFSKYTPAIDIWSIGCIFAEMLSGKPLFPGKNVVHQLDLMTDLLGTPPPETISRIRNEKAKRYLSGMRKKSPIPFQQKFPDADPLALHLLERLLAFDPKDRPSAEQALGDPYFKCLSNAEREPSTQPIPKLEFEFERRKLTKDDVRELIYREILEYHPQMLQEYLRGGEQTSFMYPSGVDRFKRQFAHLEEHPGKAGKGERKTPVLRAHASLPRERVIVPKDEASEVSAANDNPGSPPKTQQGEGSEHVQDTENGLNRPNCSARSLLKSASISASQCVVVKERKDTGEEPISEQTEEAVDGLTHKVASLTC